MKPNWHPNGIKNRSYNKSPKPKQNLARQLRLALGGRKLSPKIDENQWQIDPKSIKHQSKQPKMNQKSIKIRSTTHETSSKNRSKIDPGGPGVGPGALLGWSRRPLGPLDDSRTPPGKLLGPFLATRGQHGSNLGPNLGPNMEPKSIENRWKTTLSWDRYFFGF